MAQVGRLSPARVLWKRVLALLAGCGFALLVFELVCVVVVELGWLSARVPPYSMAASRSTFWGDLNPDFGAWHPPSANYRHQKACFDVTYQSNSYGARDIERPRRYEGPRVVVLGDSFMEGYGVALEHRLSNVLETATGVPHMNFGTSGNAGSTHSFAVYRSLVQGFEHSAVLCAILPENDFDDDLPQEGRYMPFWRGSPPSLELDFPVPAISDSAWRRAQAPAGFELDGFLRDFTYSRNVVDIFYVAWKQQRVRKKFDGADSVQASRFFRHSREEVDRLKHSYEQLARLAAPRKVVIFTIPRVPDLAAFARERRSPLDEDLAEWSSTQPNVIFVPLLAALFERFGEKATDLFLSCDPHWGPAGHRAAADILLEQAGVILRGH